MRVVVTRPAQSRATPRHWKAKVEGGKITLNAAFIESDADAVWNLEHELAHEAFRSGDKKIARAWMRLGKVLANHPDIRADVERLGYSADQTPEEIAVRLAQKLDTAGPWSEAWAALKEAAWNFFKGQWGSLGTQFTDRIAAAFAARAIMANARGRLTATAYTALAELPGVIRFGGGLLVPPWQMQAAHSIIAFHGTPHEVDQFRLANIGTGEGMQAYGWGLYFAENKAVAGNYAKSLKGTTSSPPVRTLFGEELEISSPEYHAATLLSTTGLTLAGVRKEVSGWIKNAKPGENVDHYEAVLATLNRATKKSDFKEKDRSNLYTAARRGELEDPKATLAWLHQNGIVDPQGTASRIDETAAALSGEDASTTEETRAAFQTFTVNATSIGPAILSALEARQRAKAQPDPTDDQERDELERERAAKRGLVLASAQSPGPEFSALRLSNEFSDGDTLTIAGQKWTIADADPEAGNLSLIGPDGQSTFLQEGDTLRAEEVNGQPVSNDPIASEDADTPFNLAATSTTDGPGIVAAATNPGNRKVWQPLPLTDPQRAEIEAATGQNMQGFRRMADVFAIRHIRNRHGVRSNDPHPVTDEELSSLDAILASPGVTAAAGKTRQGRDAIMHVRFKDGWFYYLEEIRQGNQVLALVGMRKAPYRAAGTEGAMPSETSSETRSDAQLLSMARERLQRAAEDFKQRRGDAFSYAPDAPSPPAYPSDPAARITAVTRAILKATGIKRLDPRRVEVVHDTRPVSTSAAPLSRAALGRGLSDLLGPRADSLLNAYQRAQEGQSTAFVSLDDLQRESGLSADAFRSAVRAGINAGTILPEPANSTTEAASFTHAVPIGNGQTAVRVVVTTAAESRATPRHWKAKVEGGRITLNAAFIESDADAVWNLEHELAHEAFRSGDKKLARAWKRLGKVLADHPDIRADVERLGYSADQTPEEVAVRLAQKLDTAGPWSEAWAALKEAVWNFFKGQWGSLGTQFTDRIAAAFAARAIMANARGRLQESTLPAPLAPYTAWQPAFAFARPEDFTRDADGNITGLKPEVQAEIEAEMAEIETRAKADGSWMKAPNGQPSKLNERQWVQVRTRRFKEWFGDWENLNRQAFLDSSPVATITLGVIQAQPGEQASDAAQRWLSQNPQTGIQNPVIGPVTFDSRSLKDTLGHGFSGPKLNALTAVRSVIERGRILDASNSFDGKPIFNWVVAAPVTLDGSRHTMFVRVRKDTAAPGSSSRFYVHEVVLEEHVKNEEASPFKTGSDPEVFRGRKSGGTGFYLSLARQAFSVNPDSVSKVVDENGEPLVVWHGTDALEDFTTFNRDTSRSDVLPNNALGHFFTPAPESASYFAEGGIFRQRGASRIYPVFLSIKSPQVVSSSEFNEWNNGTGGMAQSADGIFVGDSNPSLALKIVAPDPAQIKSATANTGTFSGDTGDIRYNLAPNDRLIPAIRRNGAMFEALPGESHLEIVARYLRKRLPSWERENATSRAIDILSDPNIDLELGYYSKTTGFIDSDTALDRWLPEEVATKIVEEDGALNSESFPKDGLPILAQPRDIRYSFAPDPAPTLPRQPVTLPPAVIASNLGVLRNHPDHNAAKAGDTDAAFRAVRDTITPTFIEQVRGLIGNESPVIVPVLAIEQGGNNKLPLAGARYLANAAGLTVTHDIVQAERANRGSMSGLDRVFKSVSFQGRVQPGQTYLLLDDTLTQGGTLADLASFIQSQGGRVIGAAALTGHNYSATLALSNETLRQLRDKHGQHEDAFREARGHGFDGLTESEARTLLKWKPADAVRDRILAERDARSGSSSARTSQTGTGRAQPLDAPVLTPSGWQPIGALQPGAPILSHDGEPSTVTGTYPQGRKPVFKITLADGRTVRATDDHLWLVKWKDGVEAQVIRTKDLRSLIADGHTLELPALTA